MSTIRILGIPGSLRRDSANGMLLRATARLAASGVEVEPWGGLATVPPFDEDVEDDTPAAVADLRAAVAAADALLISTPEYNTSIPGQLKNALDWASRPYGDSVLGGLPVAIVSASPSGYGAAWAGEQLAGILTASGAAVQEQRFALPAAHEAFTEDGGLVDQAHAAAVTAVLGELVETARARSASDRAA